MTWVKIDDKLTTHPKWLTLTLEAKSLWFHASVWCGAHNNDGVIPEHALPLIAFGATVPPSKTTPSTTLLVKSGLWHRNRKSNGGGFLIHDWETYQPTKQQVQSRAAKDEATLERKRLHAWLHGRAVGKRVKALVIARDGSWCRYCGQECRLDSDHRGPTSRTFDLIDPSSTWDREATAAPAVELARLAEMWVVACGWCNAIKQSRTPDEADMVLLDPPRRCGNGTQRDRHAIGLEPDRETGSDRDGTGLRGSALPIPAARVWFASDLEHEHGTMNGDHL